MPTISLDPINAPEPSNIPRTATDISPDDLQAVLSAEEVDTLWGQPQDSYSDDEKLFLY